MSASVKAPIHGTVIATARRLAKCSLEEAAHIISVPPETIHSWENDQDQPTLDQLRDLSNVYDVNVAVLLASSPKIFDTTTPAPVFDGDPIMSRRLFHEIRVAQERRRTFLQLHKSDAYSPKILCFTVEDTMYRLRKTTHTVAEDNTNPQQILEALIAEIEELGVLIFHADTIPLTEFSGISIYEHPTPIIILNSKNSPQGTVATLIHQLGHIIQKTNRICPNHTNTCDQEERWCNELTNTILASYDQILSKTGEENRNTSKPSPEQTILRQLGTPYITSILTAVDEERLSPLDASYFLDTTTPIIDKIRHVLAT